MTREQRSFGSFGAPTAEPNTKDDEVQMPTPVLHVGEVHADLVLNITEQTLSLLGSQIASMIAQATKAGFEHGLSAALGEADHVPIGNPDPPVVDLR